MTKKVCLSLVFLAKMMMMMKRALSLLSGSGQGATLSGWCPRPITTNRGKEGEGGVVTKLKKRKEKKYIKKISTNRGKKSPTKKSIH